MPGLAFPFAAPGGPPFRRIKSGSDTENRGRSPWREKARKPNGEKIIEPLRPLAVPIDSVRPDPGNARVHPPRNVEALKRSLSAYGQRKPIVVNRSEDNRIIAGNGLWRAAKELGWKRIAAVFVEDDPATATGYALMDNQSALLAEWDFGRLRELVAELQEADFELELTGFDLDDLPDIDLDEENEEKAVKSGSLTDRFVVPPFSVLDARKGYWQERKRAWLALGIQSELGRGEDLLALQGAPERQRGYRQAAELKPNRFACFVVGDIRDERGYYRNFVSDTIAAFQDAGAKLYNEAILVTPAGSLPIRVGRQFSSARKLGKTHQNVLVFVKGDWHKAVEDCGPVEVGGFELEGAEDIPA